ncbi:hypothetical protein DFR29_107298 [Tahibacter aquaticus]|uniref:Uncharacterized protein n=2 Tax=Tahibacter aquaticus TaxID=520092 RepID=A0A4R6YWW2_9GAMM|nr:hypothetical protein DFR29_107298 [Tahibacter aquaticus]
MEPRGRDMYRANATAALKKPMGAISFGLTLPFYFFSPEGLAQFGGESVMQRWQEYARQSIQPDFSWAEPESLKVAPQLLELAMASSRSGTSSYVPIGNNALIGVSVRSGLVEDLPSSRLGDDGIVPRLIPESRPGLHRYIVAPSYVQGWGDSGRWSVAALFAYQRFANATFGDKDVTPESLRLVEGAGPAAYGRGVRVEFSEKLGQRLRWTASYQSRVNMDAFNSYRGVYADPGDFDIPASMGVNVGYAPSSWLSFDFGLERVKYSEIRAFTSPGLPRRFLATLGSGASPVFAWGDLDVYSLSSTWHGGRLGDLGLRYSTRTQPAPTSQLLDRLLGDVSNYSLDLSYSHAIGDNGQFRFVTSYAPSQYLFGTLTNYAARNSLVGNQLEFEAVWATRF